jgi:hypothetical protein
MWWQMLFPQKNNHLLTCLDFNVLGLDKIKELYPSDTFFDPSFAKCRERAAATGDGAALAGGGAAAGSECVAPRGATGALSG